MNKLLLVIVGIIIGNNIVPEGFFASSWLDSKSISVTDKVTHIDGRGPDVGKFYSFCKQGTVLHIVNENHILVRWEGCSSTEDLEDGAILYDMHSRNDLVRK